jgi:hypothetical protein
MPYGLFNDDQMECATNALLSVPVVPRETYQLRLALAACKAAPDLSEQDIWKGARDRSRVAAPGKCDTSSDVHNKNGGTNRGHRAIA